MSILNSSGLQQFSGITSGSFSYTTTWTPTAANTLVVMAVCTDSNNVSLGIASVADDQGSYNPDETYNAAGHFKQGYWSRLNTSSSARTVKFTMSAGASVNATFVVLELSGKYNFDKTLLATTYAGTNPNGTGSAPSGNALQLALYLGTTVSDEPNAPAGWNTSSMGIPASGWPSSGAVWVQSGSAQTINWGPISVSDTAGLTVVSYLPVTVNTSGLTIVSTSPLSAATVGAPYAARLIASSGLPPYTWSLGTVTGTNTWYVTPDGWLYGAPSTAETDTLVLTVTDSGQNATSQTFSITVGSTLILGNVDPVSGRLNLPPAHVGSAYKASLAAYGGTAPYAFTVSAGSLPTGLTLASGVISGTPTLAGNPACTIQVADSASHTASASLQLNVSAASTASRPSGNTGAGFYVSGTKFYDPTGNEFRIRGFNRNHFDGASWTGGVNGALMNPNTSRVFMFNIGSTGGFNTASAFIDVIVNQSIGNNILPIVTATNIPNTATQTAGDTSTTDLNAVVAWWVANVAVFAPYMAQIVINIANEWGPVGSGWATAYQSAIPSLRSAGYTCPILIDAPGSGQDWGTLVASAASVFAADTQKNTFFAWHAYGSVSSVSIPISNITNANPAVVTLNFPNTGAHPFSYPTGAYTGIAPNNNTFNGVTAYSISGVTGMNINGANACSVNNLGGVQNSSPWTLTLSTNSTALGAYAGGGQIVASTNQAGSGAPVFYQQAISQLSALSVCVIVGEFGPGRNIGPSPTLTSISEMVTASEGYGLGWLYWAEDDHDNADGSSSNNWFGVSNQPNNGAGYWTGALSGLTQQGLDLIENARYGLFALPTRFALFDYYISPTGSDSNAGTFASPWAITAINTKRALYAGKKVGLLNGTYSVYSLVQAAGSYLNSALLVQGGTASNPTVIAAVNPRKAILDAHQTPGQTGAGYPTANAGIIGVGQGDGAVLQGIGNIVIDGLVCTGSVDYCVHFFCKSSNTQTVPGGQNYSGQQYGGATGIVIRNCEIYDVSSLSFGDNPCAIGLSYTTGALIHNCVVHPMLNSGTNKCQGFLSFNCYQTTVQYCTIYSCGSAIEEKEGPQGASTYQYNYFEGFDFVGLGTVRDAVGGLPGWTVTFHHNIVASASGDGWSTGDSTNPGQYTQVSILCYNNTFYDTAQWTTTGFVSFNWGTGNSTSPAAALTHYNNIYYPVANGSSGSDIYFASGPGCMALSDYNCFRPSINVNAMLYSIPAGGGALTGHTLATWRTAFSMDAHSFGANPSMVNPVIGGSAGGTPSPVGFKLNAGSACLGAGRIGGVSTGAATNIGAWDGTVTQIGANFTAGQ